MSEEDYENYCAEKEGSRVLFYGLLLSFQAILQNPDKDFALKQLQHIVENCIRELETKLHSEED